MPEATQSASTVQATKLDRAGADGWFAWAQTDDGSELSTGYHRKKHGAVTRLRELCNLLGWTLPKQLEE